QYRKFDQGKNPGLEIRFSDPLDQKQDITGLVRFEPNVKFTFKTVRKSLFITGNFAFGQPYSLKMEGIRSKWGAVLGGDPEHQFTFEDRKPRLSFMSGGLFLTSSNQRKVGFKTVNVKNVKLEIKKVFESNLGIFLQSQQIKADKQRYNRFSDYDVNRVGVTVVEKKLEIGETKNRWLNHVLDLEKLIPQGEKGIFIIMLSFTRKDMMYGGLTKNRKYYYGREYYSNPNSSGYIYRHGVIVKPVIVSDIGLTYKRGHQQHLVFATNLLNASPMSGVKVTLRTYQNQVAAQKWTDGDGKAEFDDIMDTIFYIEAEKDNQRSMIKPAEMGWNLSSFDTGGVVLSADETRAFIYTERGVYRPGDSIYLSVIARNKDNTFPEDHPVTLEVYNPKNQLMVKEISQKAIDGFYGFRIDTKPEDLTGNWKAKILVGSRTFFHPLKIETVVPNRLKVKVEPEKKKLGPGDGQLKFDVVSNYLFGAPAAFLKAEVSVNLRHQLKTFPKYHGFVFNNEAVKFKSIKTDVYNNALDGDGKAVISWQLPGLTKSPSAVAAGITAKVFVKGGRATRNDHVIAVDPYNRYVGVEKPRFKYGYGQVGKPLQFNTILVDTEGSAVAGRQLVYKIYKNSRYWWWEYDRRENFRLKYKKDSATQLVLDGELISKKIPQAIKFNPEDMGEYLIEVSNGDDGENGHTAAFFFSAYYWGEAPSGVDSAGTLTLKSDKPVYRPGDEAVVSFPSPQEGSIFFSVEKGGRILFSSVYKAVRGENSERQISFAVTEEMLPNVYVSVSIIQPFHQMLNDRPLRMYGIIPLLVEEPETRRRIRLDMPESLRPNEDFQVTVNTADNKPVQFTIAVVDEGLLDLTAFQTPNPWKEFFKKQKLGIQTFDLFSFVIGANKGDIFRLFSIGGDMDAGYRASQLQPEKVQRFKPVAMFKGPMLTDDDGRAVISFKMPDYIGSVRVMVVAADGNNYGSAAKAVPVKTELMVLPTLPRVLGPGDRFVLPVTVFAMEEKIKDVAVSVKTEGPVQVVGAAKQNLSFPAVGEEDTAFTLLVQPEVGPAAVTITAKSADFKMEKRTDINIRPYSPRIYSSEIKACARGDKVNITIPDGGIRGTNRATVSVVRKPKLKLDHRLGWLIRYPYGCIEQTTSSVFPQLYLKSFMKKSVEDERKIDENINAGIERLRRFRVPSGGFAYWPGGKKASIWGTNYGGQFLVEAKKLGYNVPADLLDGWLRFQRSQALAASGNLMERTHRLYVLALAGEPRVGPMNLLKENSLKQLSNTQKWMLAAAYHLSGNEETARHIFKEASLQVNDYRETGGTYGSRLRDLAIILEVQTLFQDWNKADGLYDDILDAVAGKNWHSTQTLGYSLMALGKYIKANAGDFREDKPVMSGYIKLPGNKKIPFHTEELKFSQVIDTGFGEEVEVYFDNKTGLERGFVTMEWNGVPLDSNIETVSKNLKLDVEWLDDNGMSIDPARVKQGKTFWGHFKVGISSYSRDNLEELALVQVLPSGWEIENIRLLKEAVPEWMKKWNLNREEYLDIRDDRVMWFFDLRGYNTTYDFVVKLTAVTAGEFVLPPTLFEAMYDNKYKAILKGKPVTVFK
ncbi:MAG: alpha-2-macroglobulin family protein, partial [bacterium]|nr:alpha-2-macroglobulin family protein [bacterium]